LFCCCFSFWVLVIVVYKLLLLSSVIVLVLNININKIKFKLVGFVDCVTCLLVWCYCLFWLFAADNGVGVIFWWLFVCRLFVGLLCLLCLVFVLTL